VTRSAAAAIERRRAVRSAICVLVPLLLTLGCGGESPGFDEVSFEANRQGEIGGIWMNVAVDDRNAWRYCCTNCGSMLNPAGVVTLVGVFGGAQMMIGFHPEPGNYELFAPPEARFERGDRWNFYCPVCRSNLQSEGNPDLCELIQYEGDERKRLFFSRVAGEHATFVVGDESSARRAERHGEHAEKYDTTVDLIIIE
jgi:hypothetical protein